MRATYFEVDADGGTFRLTAVYEKDAIPIPDKMRLSDFSPELENDYRMGRTLFVQDTEIGLQREAYKAIGVRAWAAVPLVKGSQLVAIVGVHSKTPRKWTKVELQLLEELAERTWAAVERARAEEALRKSEQRLRLATDAADMYAWDIDLTTMTPRFSENVATVTGREHPPDIGLNMQRIHPDDRDLVFRSFEEAKTKPDGIFDFEIRSFTDENNMQWLRIVGKVLRDSNGMAVMYAGICQNVTQKKEAEEALRQSEERMRATMESATDFAIITMDHSRKIVSWNKGAEYIFGYSESEMIGQTADAIFTTEDREMGIPQREQEQADREGRANDERWHQRKDGSRIFMSGVMVPMRSNILPGYVKIARDITEAKLLEQRKEEFVGIASHELKTPVTSIKVYTDILLELLKKADNEQYLDLLQRLNTQVDRLTQLINDLLDTTKISEGRLKLRLERLNIAGLLQERVEEMRGTTSHRFVLEIGATKDIVADRERIGQVITNLLSNAARYSHEGTDIIIVCKDMGNGIQVSVHDSGKGISAEDQKKIFDRFYRATTSDMDTYPGMGLGLYISAQIIQRHGGTISVQSIEGKGSVFQFTLPYIPEVKE